MFRPIVAIALLGQSLPAWAQRTGENPVAAAQDAFGTSVGNERIGLYSPGNARGFSPVQTGNVRIDGVYVDYQAELNERLVAGNTVRVGLAAQGYPFPAPTGVADFALRLPGAEALASAVIGVGPYAGLRAEVDAQLPLSERLSLSVGAGVNDEGFNYGGDRRLTTVATIGRWRPGPDLELVPFWSIQDSRGGEAQPVIFTAGAFLPPRIERRRYFGPDWALNASGGTNLGLLGSATLGGWAMRGGVFRSVASADRAFNPLFLNTTPEGEADRVVIAEQGRRTASTSGEIRLSRSLRDDRRLHVVHLIARGRMQDRLYGGSQRFAFGRGRIDHPIDVPAPALAQGVQTTDRVRQATIGVGYEGRWMGLGELSLGLQRTFYEKAVVRPSGALPISRARPWLANGMLSILAGEGAVFYAGYSRGLEESPVAPDVAVNRGEAPPAIITAQKDAGVRLSLTGSLRLVAGVFDVRKPYFGLDAGRLFRQLGVVRNRGIELSIAGQVTSRLSIVGGAVFLDATLSGDAVRQGLVGRRPVTSIGRVVTGGVNWSLPWLAGVSLDASYEGSSDRIANAANTLVIPARYTASIGARYRFRLAGNAATLRGQVGAVNDPYGFANFGEGFYYNLPRRAQISLTVDL